MWKRVKYARAHIFTIGVIYARKDNFVQKGRFSKKTFLHENTFETKATFAQMVILHESKKRQIKMKMKFIKKNKR